MIEHNGVRRLTAKVNEKVFAERVISNGDEKDAFLETWKWKEPEREGGYHKTNGARVDDHESFVLWTLDQQKRATIGTQVRGKWRTRRDLPQDGGIAKHYTAIIELLKPEAADVPLTSVMMVYNTPKWMRKKDYFHLKCFIDPEVYFTRYASYDELPKTQREMLAREAVEDRELYDERFRGDSYAQNARDVLSDPVEI